MVKPDENCMCMCVHVLRCLAFSGLNVKALLTDITRVPHQTQRKVLRLALVTFIIKIVSVCK